MQDYFTHAKHVGDLTRIFLAALEARHVKPRPSLGEKLRTVFAFGKDADRPRLPAEARPARLRRRDAFRKDPVNILRLFEEGAGHRHPDPSRRAAPGRREPRPDRRRACAPIAGGEPHLPRAAARPQQPRARAAADERGRRPRRLHPRVRPHRRDDAVQHVPLLHGGRAHHPHDLDPLPDRARRAGRRPADRHRHHRQGRRPPGALRRAAAARHRQGVGPRPFRRSAPRSPSGSARASASTPRRPSWWSGWCATTC